MKLRVRNLSSSFDAEAYRDLVKDAYAQAEQRREALRAMGFRPRREAIEAEDLSVVTGLVSAPRKVDVDDLELEEEEIRFMIRAGKLEARDLVSADGAQWSTIGQHPSFYDLFEADEVHGHGFPWIPVVIIGAVVIAALLLAAI